MNEQLLPAGFSIRAATIILGVDSQSKTGAVQLYQRVGMRMERETISY
jgi:hypothetical protein